MSITITEGGTGLAEDSEAAAPLRTGFVVQQEESKNTSIFARRAGSQFMDQLRPLQSIPAGENTHSKGTKDGWREVAGADSARKVYCSDPVPGGNRHLTNSGASPGSSLKCCFQRWVRARQQKPGLGTAPGTALRDTQDEEDNGVLLEIVQSLRYYGWNLLSASVRNWKFQCGLWFSSNGIVWLAKQYGSFLCSLLSRAFSSIVETAGVSRLEARSELLWQHPHVLTCGLLKQLSRSL
ncbi:hypothetical protein MG293_002323 [Ovis ammon polii]|uniref:Uncharacterized protein n=1 Tax=Ovis ammon polii TaxID=230172 RepID=A0AAD4UGF0_OVIAM|nr:hypothetical protein MG293_002323 [Ovis ammon polii]